MNSISENRQAELGRAEKIMEIAIRAYTYMETLGRVVPDANREMWAAEGGNYKVTFNPYNSNFFVESTENDFRDEMNAQTIDGELDSDCVDNVTEDDLILWKECQKALDSLTFERSQSPAETQAKASKRWSVRCPF